MFHATETVLQAFDIFGSSPRKAPSISTTLGPRKRHDQHLPLRRSTLLLHLSEDTFRFVVETLCARGHFPVTFDLLLATHVARLYTKGTSTTISISLPTGHGTLPPNEPLGKLTLAILLLLESWGSSIAIWS